DGIVVFLDFEGAWSERIEAAAVARSPDEARALEARGHHDAGRNVVVDPYLIEVRESGGGFVPIRTRERVRIAGPSVLGDVPGYAAPTSNPSPHRSSRWGEGRGEGQPHTAAHVAAPYPSPLPLKNGEREKQAQAA
ncbi:MAG TPA: DUF2849 domain-containing protein, partial [Hyphomicrobiaceae bacterium]|nr:DUF2849 domain-containing protein [Hyphomicrobiaceae bacterium]